ncbi:NAD(P)/FAD-dependent oxidoreductase [Algoriphagus namhaensis]
MDCLENLIFDKRFNLLSKGVLQPENIHISIIGGGLAGLVSAYLLAKAGKQVLLIEKKKYPFHRVCGEYISNEAKGFLKDEGLLPTGMDLPHISEFQFSDTVGRQTTIPLDLGGFGVSRFVLDEHIYGRAKEVGARILEGLQVENVRFDKETDSFELELSDHRVIRSEHVIGAFGKRSKLDKVLEREFIQRRSPYLGVKYHIKTDLPRDFVALHNFTGGYCGINAIENDRFNLCYLGSRDQLREAGSIPEMERMFLWKNPKLQRIFNESEFLFEKPEVINEINFDPKQPVENHILMAGDAAGLITPLCGNGMAIAIQSGKLAAEALLRGGDRFTIESNYAQSWTELFKWRLWVGRNVQRLFGSRGVSSFTRTLIAKVPLVANQIIRNTHGQPF